ncbi:MAG: hypothetical protein JXM72_11530 [Deltaproteobacteria bacterium]|nr:hypothetical protein [Deltaproteobacteria bacterium]
MKQSLSIIKRDIVITVMFLSAPAFNTSLAADGNDTLSRADCLFMPVEQLATRRLYRNSIGA